MKHYANAAYLFGVIRKKNRFRILALLLISEMSVAGIKKKLKIEQALLSKHFQVLRKSGLVETKKRSSIIFHFSSQGKD